MLKRTLTYLSGGLALMAGLALATEAVPEAPKEQLYGSQLMTPQEQAAHRARMRVAQTPEEKAKLRVLQHERMQDRARQLGVEIPAAPPAVGGGMGPGAGTGGGMGMGPGGGGGRNR